MLAFKELKKSYAGRTVVDIKDLKIEAGETIGLVGNNLLKLDFIPINGNDSYSFNNFIQQNFTVTKDNKEPIVDVAFDGKQIINRETVSPNPNISISILDENKYLLLKDTSAIEVYLKDGDNGDFKRVSFSSGKLSLENTASESNNKITYSFKIYPIYQTLEDKEYYNLVYEKFGDQWNEIIRKSHGIVWKGRSNCSN